MEQTMEQIAAEIKASTEKFDRETMHGKWTIAELKEAFNKALQPKQNWKDHIVCLVDMKDADRFIAGIEFMVGGSTRRVPVANDQVVLINDGYYANIGA